MSATMQPNWLETVDFKGYLEGLATLKLSEDDRGNGVVKQRIAAKKQLSRATARIGDATTGVRLELTSYAAPCKKIAPAFTAEHFVRVSQKVHAGWSRLYARVLEPGRISLGDRVVTEESH